MANVRLNIGAGKTAKQPGELNADLFPGPNIDVVFDATRTWPFKDNSIQSIYSNHMLEHLPEPWTFFREAYRVLTPSPLANLYICLPYGASDAGIGDLTHLRQYIPVSFCCFQPGYNESVFNPQHDDWNAPFSVMQIQLVIDKAFRWATWPVVRRWALPYLRFFWGAINEMKITMRALKTERDIQLWKATYKANEVPISYLYIKK